jgi:hypothetical protein
MTILTHEIEALFRQQLQSWPLLAKGVEGLTRAQTRAVRIDWFDVFVRHIPHRVGSTTAAVDPESIQRRPCFLCAENLPSEQKGIRFGPDFTFYCNPFPIVDRHLTIVHREHRPQAISGQIGNMLQTAAALPGYFVIYNGPACGASAPDHLHFQAGLRNLFPIEQDTLQIEGPPITGYARNVFVFRSSEASTLVRQIERTIDLLAEVTGTTEEPLLNIAGFCDSQRGWTIYVFPRGKHRPSVYHTGELTVSPASIDLCGIFVAPLERDFARIGGDDITAIFREVTLLDNQFADVTARLERAV